MWRFLRHSYMILKAVMNLFGLDDQDFRSFSHDIFSWPCCAVGSAVTWKVWLSNTKEVKFDTALIIFSFFFVKPKPCNHLSFLRHFGFLPKSAGRQWLFLHTPTRCRELEKEEIVCLFFIVYSNIIRKSKDLKLDMY